MKTAPLLAIIADWRALLDSDVREEHVRDLREHSRTRRPLGNSSFLDRLEEMVSRTLRLQNGVRPSKLRRIP